MRTIQEYSCNQVRDDKIIREGNDRSLPHLYELSRRAHRIHFWEHQHFMKCWFRQILIKWRSPPAPHRFRQSQFLLPSCISSQEAHMRRSHSAPAKHRRLLLRFKTRIQTRLFYRWWQLCQQLDCLKTDPVILRTAEDAQNHLIVRTFYLETGSHASSLWEFRNFVWRLWSLFTQSF